MASLIARRKTLLVFAAFAFLLFCFHGPSSSNYRLPYPNSVRNGIDWQNVLHHYPVQSMASLPTYATKLPAIQHDFPPEDPEAREVRLQRQAEVKENFLHAWNGYKKHAWLHDELSPLTGYAPDPFGGWAATLVDSLDTLWIMNLTDEFDYAVRAINKIDFSSCSLEEINVFETTIRYLGGFLAAYDLTDGQYPTLLAKATEMGHMLYKAFDTPNRMPITRWNFKSAAEGIPQEADETVLVAEIGSLTLEFTRLSQLTGDNRWFDAVQRITDVFESQQRTTMLPGMWPTIFNAKAMSFSTATTFTIGGMVDSLYEYLPKQHMLLGGTTRQYRKLYQTAAAAIKRNMLFRPMVPGNKEILMVGDVSTDGLQPPQTVYLEPKVQHLTCFAGGMFALAGALFSSASDLETGRRLTEGCLWAYEASPHGIMPEILYTQPCPDDAVACEWQEDRWFEAVAMAYGGPDASIDAEHIIQQTNLRKGVARVADPRYLLRPEAIESVFVLYRISGQPHLPDRAYRMFEHVVRATRTPLAHAALADVSVEPEMLPQQQMDRMESFWLAETLKYFYLVFSEPGVVSLDEWVFNTEAHPFRRPGAGATGVSGGGVRAGQKVW